MARYGRSESLIVVVLGAVRVRNLVDINPIQDGIHHDVAIRLADAEHLGQRFQLLDGEFARVHVDLARLVLDLHFILAVTQLPGHLSQIDPIGLQGEEIGGSPLRQVLLLQQLVNRGRDTGPGDVVGIRQVPGVAGRGHLNERLARKAERNDGEDCQNPEKRDQDNAAIIFSCADPIHGLASSDH